MRSRAWWTGATEVGGGCSGQQGAVGKTPRTLSAACAPAAARNNEAQVTPSPYQPPETGTCILFGDGCGAVVLRAAAAAGAEEQQPCSLLSFSMNSDGGGQRHLNALFCGGGMKPRQEDGAASGPSSYSNIAMNGPEVFKFAVRAVPTVIEAALAKAGMQKEEIDWLVLHQVRALRVRVCVCPACSGVLGEACCRQGNRQVAHCPIMARTDRWDGHPLAPLLPSLSVFPNTMSYVPPRRPTSASSHRPLTG